jgi:hypothetical protein
MDLKALAKIGKGTRRKKREINLLEVSEEIKSLYEINKSLDKVANIVKLSSEMVREFLKITELEEEVKEIIKVGKIKSVDIAYRISKLQGGDQTKLAKQIVEDNISSKDVRNIVQYKIDNAKISIEDAIKNNIQSKDKKIYVAYLGIDKDVFEKLLDKIKDKNFEDTIRSILENIVDKKSIVYWGINGRVIVLKIEKNALKKMREIAKDLKVPLAKLANALVEDYLKE